MNQRKKLLEKLNLVDRFLFEETMEETTAYEAAIGILMENETELLEKPETEKELRVSPQLREIRLDVIGMDRDKQIYYTEMQQKNTGNLQKRSRYYQAQLDVSFLEPGCVDFNELNDSCFIMVAPFDIFGKELYRYTFEGTCRECPELKLQDGATRIFINTCGKNRNEFSKEFLDFMDYIMETTDENAERTESKRIKTIHKQVQSIRLSEKMGVKFMQAWEEKVYDRMEGREEGLREGEALGKILGKTLGKAETVLELLEDIGAVPDCMKESILAQTNRDILKQWVKSAARAASIDEWKCLVKWEEKP